MDELIGRDPEKGEIRRLERETSADFNLRGNVWGHWNPTRFASLSSVGGNARSGRGLMAYIERDEVNVPIERVLRLVALEPVGQVRYFTCSASMRGSIHSAETR